MILVAAIAVVVSVAVLLTGCSTQQSGTGTGDQPPGFFPTPPATEQGQYIFDFYPVVFWIAVAVFVLVEGLLVWIVFRYRRRPTDTELPPQTHGHNKLEIVWTLIPAAVVTLLFAFTITTLAKVERDPNSTVQPSLAIDVTGFQWQWRFDYQAQGLSFTGVGAEGPLMAMPVNETVRIRLHATDVIHSFYVPQFLYKKDAVPGRVNEFDVVVRDVGTYTGQCAEFCGLAHADMTFNVQAMTRADFDAWVLQQQQARPSQAPVPSGTPSITPLPAAAYDSCCSAQPTTMRATLEVGER